MGRFVFMVSSKAIPANRGNASSSFIFANEALRVWVFLAAKIKGFELERKQDPMILRSGF